MTLDEPVYGKIFGIKDYRDDTEEEEVPVSLNSVGMINGVASMAMNSPPGDFMEIGVWRGGTASVLHQIAEKQSRKLYLFDLFESDNCLKAVKRFCPQASIIKGKFPDSWPGNINSISFCLFDNSDTEGAQFLINLMPNTFVKDGICMFSYTFRYDEGFKDQFAVFDGTKYPYLTKK